MVFSYVHAWGYWLLSYFCCYTVRWKSDGDIMVTQLTIPLHWSSVRHPVWIWLFVINLVTVHDWLGLFTTGYFTWMPPCSIPLHWTWIDCLHSTHDGRRSPSQLQGLVSFVWICIVFRHFRLQSIDQDKQPRMNFRDQCIFSFSCQGALGPPHIADPSRVPILRSVQLPKRNRIFASSLESLRWFNFCFCHPRKKDAYCRNLQAWDPYTAVRVGEASNPGPGELHSSVRLTQVNPTSVYQKSDLLMTQGDVVLCAETSATQAVQIQEKAVLRKLGYATVWSPPQPAQRHTIQATEDLRGKAAGLMVMSKFPVRAAHHSEPLAMWRAGRYLRSFLTIGSLTVQIVQIYGYPSCHADSRYMTNELCRHACAEAMQLDMPTLYAGDFNHPPASLPALQVLLAKGYTSSQQLYGRLYQREQPPTCRDATYNDGFLLCPTFVHWVRSITVEEQYLFADHTPVQLDIQFPVEMPTRYIWRLPQSWTAYAPSPRDLEEQYSLRRTAAPTSFVQWANNCEQAVHGALQISHNRDPLKQPYPGLPRRARGRCQPRKRVQVPLFQPIRPAGTFQYDPQIDGSSAIFRKAVRQLRRIQSLRRRLQKLTDDPTLTPDWKQLTIEWQVIGSALFDRKRFADWLATWPELPLQETFFPDLQYLDQVCQITKYHVQHLESAERRRLQAAQRYERLYDQRWSSHSGAFRKIRPVSHPCLTMVRRKTSHDISSLRGAGTGLLTCVIPSLPHPHPLADYRLGNLQLQLCSHNNQEYDFLQIEADHSLPESLVLEIIIPTTDTNQVADELNEYWSQFWTRDDQNTIWNSFSTMLQSTPSLPPMESLLTLDEWKQAVRHLKLNTARGVCGWFAQELRDLPDLALDDLRLLFMEHQTSMPAALMQARTIPLGKTSHPEQASLTRPITILSLLYRLWGRATTVKILQFWSKQFSPAVIGFLPARSMANAMIGFQRKLEKAHMGHELSYGGLTLDLVKAFNLLGREPASEAMLHYGLPPDWIQFWYESISSIDRVWEINGSLSHPFHPTTGCPEGDTWSAVAMLALSNVWVHLLEAQSPPVAPLSYADNLGWSAQEPAAHTAALSATIAWSTALRLKVDWQKTWVWATDAKHTLAWKTQRGQFPELQDVLQVTNARELGYMIAYSKCQYKKTFFARHAEAIEQCRRIARLPHAIAVKGNLLRAPLSRMLYGTELHMVSLEHLRQLRTAMARALLGSQAQPNPYLATALLHRHILDPHFQLLYHAFRTMRRYLWTLHADERSQFFSHVISHTGQPWKIFGPAGTIKYHLDFLGWTLTKHGHILTDAFGRISFLNCPLERLKQELILAWERHLQLLLSSRKEWTQTPQIDIPTTASLFSALPADRQRIVAGELTGSFQLQCRKAKWVENLDDRCPLCGDEDTVAHRRLHCPALQKARVPHQSLVTYLLDHDNILTALPVAFRHPESSFDFWWSQNVPPAVPTQAAQEKLKEDLLLGLRPLVFTDGSAAPPACPEARQAAGAAVLLPRHLTLEPEQIARLLDKYFSTSCIPAEFVTMMVTPTQGAQTIPRAELDMVLQVVRHCSQVEIVTDSQYVIDQHQKLLQMTNIALAQAQPNFDLLQQLYAIQRTPGYDVTLTKVASHQLHNGPPTWQRLLQLGNEAADQAAKEARKQLVETCRQVPPAHYREERTRVVDQFALCFDIGCLRKNILQSTTEDSSATAVSAGILGPPEGPFHVFPPDLHQVPLLRFSLWGSGFSAGILYWATQVRWPIDSFNTDISEVATAGVTWMELLLDCQHVLQLHWPHSTVSSKHPPLLRHPGLHGVNQVDIPFTWNLSNFRRAIRHLEDLLQVKLLPTARATVNSLYRLGARGHKKGIPWRPILCCPMEVERSLQQYFREHPHCSQFRHQPILHHRPPMFTVHWHDEETSFDPDIGKRRLARFTSWKQRGRPSPLHFGHPK